MVIGSGLVKIRRRAQEKEVRAGALAADVITQGKQTVKGLRRNSCTLPTFKRRIEEIRKRDSTTVHTEKKGP